MLRTAAQHLTFLFLISALSLHAASAQEKQIETVSGQFVSAAAVDRFIERQMDSLKIPGMSVAIINDANVVYHRAVGVANADSTGEVDETSIFEAASLSKPVFAYLALKMVEEAVLDLDTPLHQYVPIEEVQNGWYKDVAGDERSEQITARMVLSHTTGLPNWRWDNPDEKLSIQFAPGDKFSYSGEGYELLADVIAHLKGVDLEGLGRLFQKEMATPLGMKHASFVYEDSVANHKVRGHVDGEPTEQEWCCDGRAFLASGNLHTEAVSYANFLTALMGDEGLSEDLIDEMLTAQVDIPEGHSRRIEDGVAAWGLGAGIQNTPYGTKYTHGGTNEGFRSGFAFYKDKGVGYVLFTNSGEGSKLNERLETFLMEGAETPRGSSR